MFDDMKNDGCGGDISACKKWLLILCGALTGGANGLFGGGGGMIAVPALTGIVGLEQKQAHATAIMVILPVTIISAVIYLFTGEIDFSVLVPSAIGVTAGGIVGAAAMDKLSSPILQLLFALVMFFAGLKSALA